MGKREQQRDPTREPRVAVSAEGGGGTVPADLNLADDPAESQPTPSATVKVARRTEVTVRLAVRWVGDLMIKIITERSPGRPLAYIVVCACALATFVVLDRFGPWANDRHVPIGIWLVNIGCSAAVFGIGVWLVKPTKYRRKAQDRSSRRGSGGGK